MQNCYRGFEGVIISEFHIALCCYHSQDREFLLSLLDKYDKNCLDVDIEIFCFDSGGALLQKIESGQEYDLYILDTLMPAGIGLAEKIRTFDDDVPLIFLCGSTEYAFDAFRVSAYQYLLKPAHEVELFNIFNKILAAAECAKNEFCLFPASGSTVKITFSEIIYIELYDRTMMAHLKNGDMLRSKTIRVSFAEAIGPLLADNRFLQSHRSFILNMDHVREMTSKSFIMTDNSEIPIPRYKYADAKSKYLCWLSYRGISTAGMKN